ncbi:MAG: cobalamin biosynthesis protein CobD [Nitrospirae bacterium]|nr:cobalamin biosynthesis protein CobD [Nitrospirota bacterium]
MLSPIELLLAFSLDAVVGDPKWLPHPVRLIGKAVEKGEELLRNKMDGKAGGVVLAAGIVVTTFVVMHFLVLLLRAPSSGYMKLIGSMAVVFLASTTLALMGLIGSVRDVYMAGNIEEARLRLSHIVGRDTGDLGEDGVRRAAIETLAENTSDGVVAPLFYLALGGVPLAMAYKAVNTLDSMVGYRNERYMEFGWASARLDDLLNYIPARLTGLLIVAAVFVLSGFSKEEALRAFKVMLSDGRKHTSPNAGYPEAAMAGALNVRLGGPSTYGGNLIEKPLIFATGSADYGSAGPYALKITFAASALGVFAAACGLLWWGA